MPQKDESQVPIPTPEQSAQLNQLAHRVQSGVAFLQGQAEIKGERYESTEPKHLRVGVNSALVEASALAALLFRKKVITAEEYFDTLIEFWGYEVDSYQRNVKAIDGRFSI